MEKSSDAFRTISEVSKWLGVPTHVLRFWESRFPEISPVKRAGGRRYYRPEDMKLLGGIKTLLHDQSKPIKEVQELLAEAGSDSIMGHSPALEADDADEPSADNATVEAIDTDAPQRRWTPQAESEVDEPEPEQEAAPAPPPLEPTIEEEPADRFEEAVSEEATTADAPLPDVAFDAEPAAADLSDDLPPAGGNITFGAGEPLLEEPIAEAEAPQATADTEAFSEIGLPPSPPPPDPAEALQPSLPGTEIPDAPEPSYGSDAPPEQRPFRTRRHKKAASDTPQKGFFFNDMAEDVSPPPLTAEEKADEALMGGGHSALHALVDEPLLPSAPDPVPEETLETPDAPATGIQMRQPPPSLPKDPADPAAGFIWHPGMVSELRALTAKELLDRLPPDDLGALADRLQKLRERFAGSFQKSA